MKKKVVILCMAFVLLFTSQPAAVIQANELEEAKKKQEELEKGKQEVSEKLDLLKESEEDILEYIERMDSQMNNLNDEITGVQKKYEKVSKKYKKTKIQLANAKKEEEVQYAKMKKRIQYMYENGNEGYLNTLLTSSSVAQLLNRTEYVSKIADYDNRLFQDYKKLKEQVAIKTKEVKEQRQQIAELKESLIDQRASMQDISDAKQEELLAYQKTISKSSSELTAYEKKIQQTEEEIEAILEKQRQAEDAAAAAGSEDAHITVGESGYRWPLNVSGRITSTFGYRKQPTAGASTYHKGIDIATPVGTDVCAAAAGKVVTASYSASGGNYVMIYHGDSTYTVYMHCSSLCVSVGDMVSQGDVVAKSGNTGVSTGPHLHFAISVKGNYVNPLIYVKQP
ncbi:MAG: peptidoglycan DD-metalloendopeptidase family protein [Clostridiales bacterium]|nr:peptidoglycan DD-metalloendopeptidase family protein [Clostridiales bacterium]